MQETQVQSLGQEESSGVRIGIPFQYSCLENPMSRGAWQATVHGIVESDSTKQLTLCYYSAIYHNLITGIKSIMFILQGLWRLHGEWAEILGAILEFCWLQIVIGYFPTGNHPNCSKIYIIEKWKLFRYNELKQLLNCCLLGYMPVCLPVCVYMLEFHSTFKNFLVLRSKDHTTTNISESRDLKERF